MGFRFFIAFVGWIVALPFALGAEPARMYAIAGKEGGDLRLYSIIDSTFHVARADGTGSYFLLQNKPEAVIAGPDSRYLWACGNGRLIRYDSNDIEPATSVTLREFPAHHSKLQMVLSRDGSRLALLAQDGEISHLWVCDSATLEPVDRGYAWSRTGGGDFSLHIAPGNGIIDLFRSSDQYLWRWDYRRPWPYPYVFGCEDWEFLYWRGEAATFGLMGTEALTYVGSTYCGELQICDLYYVEWTSELYVGGEILESSSGSYTAPRWSWEAEPFSESCTSGPDMFTRYGLPMRPGGAPDLRLRNFDDTLYLNPWSSTVYSLLDGKAVQLFSAPIPREQNGFPGALGMKLE